MTAEAHMKQEFTLFYERENDALFRFCLWRVTSRDVALELTQEVFARLWSRMATREVANPRAFIYLVARHLIIDWYRKVKPSSLDALREEGEEPFEPRDEGAFEAIETGFEARRVLELLNKLPAQYREVVYLRFVEELPPREIAKILKTSPNAVSVRISRGLEVFKKLSGIEDIET